MFLDTTGVYSERRRNRRRPCECRAELSKYAAARPLFALRAGRMAGRCPLKSWGPSGGNDFWGNPQEGVAVFPGVGTLRIIFVRTQAPSIGRSAPSVGIQSPSFPSGIPPPRGIRDSPRIMHDKRWFPTRTYHGALAYFERRALPAEIPARGEEFGARKLKPVSTRLYGVARHSKSAPYGVARHSKSAPRLSSGGCAACESLAERRVIPSSKTCSARLRTPRISECGVKHPRSGRLPRAWEYRPPPSRRGPPRSTGRKRKQTEDTSRGTHSGLSSPTRNRGQSSYHARRAFVFYSCLSWRTC